MRSIFSLNTHVQLELETTFLDDIICTADDTHQETFLTKTTNIDILRYKYRGGLESDGVVIGRGVG